MTCIPRSAVFSATILCCATFASAETCDVCSIKVRITDARATCILDKADEFAAHAQNSITGFVMVDIENCSYGAGGSRGVVGKHGDDPEPAPDESLILDADGFLCLRGLIAKAGEELSPEMTFNLLAAC